jgi:hypothetical protein
MKINTKNNLVWHKFEELLSQIDVKALARDHLEDCQYKIMGYWDENEYYEEIVLTEKINIKLIRSSLSVTLEENPNSHSLELNFLLETDPSIHLEQPVSDIDRRIGELTLIFDPNLDFLDENWLINVQSPFVIAKGGQKLTSEISAA